MTWFLEDAALPSIVFGPQESFALAWLAAICASVAIESFFERAQRAPRWQAMSASLPNALCALMSFRA